MLVYFQDSSVLVAGSDGILLSNPFSFFVPLSINSVLCSVFKLEGRVNGLGNSKVACRLVLVSGFQGLSLGSPRYCCADLLWFILRPPTQLVCNPSITLSSIARLRQRMGCRGGHPWRAPTGSSMDSLAPTSELFTGCYRGTRSGRGRRKTSSHYCGPPSSIGSAIFTFNSSLHWPRITAHITIFFYETTQLEGSDSHPGGSEAVVSPSSTIQLGMGIAPQNVQEAPGCSIQGAEMLPVDPGPSNDIPDFSWCQIVEERPAD